MRSEAGNATSWRKRVGVDFPYEINGTIWSKSLSSFAQLPAQGWKIHVSCHPLNALTVLALVGPYIRQNAIAAKTLTFFSDIKKINCGLFYAYTQIGKIFTIYCHDQEELKLYGKLLAKILIDQSGPSVPFDLRLYSSKALFYRYGAFIGDTITDDSSREVFDNRRVPIPPWMTAPFPHDSNINRSGAVEFPLVYDCFSQRGKGGVYLALDFCTSPPRKVILKEGRRFGEIDLEGRNGFLLVSNEAKILKLIKGTSRSSISPRLISSFASSTAFFVVQEYIQAEDLRQYIMRTKLTHCFRKTREKIILRLISNLVELHSIGVTWLDMKPSNVLCKERVPIFIDFEGSELSSAPPRGPWGSTGFVPPEWLRPQRSSRVAQDLFALGALIRFIMHGIVLHKGKILERHMLKSDKRLDSLVEMLTDRRWRVRPTAYTALKVARREFSVKN